MVIQTALGNLTVMVMAFVTSFSIPPSALTVTRAGWEQVAEMSANTEHLYKITQFVTVPQFVTMVKGVTLNVLVMECVI